MQNSSTQTTAEAENLAKASGGSGSGNNGNVKRQIDYNLVKSRFSLERFCRENGIPLRRGSKGSQVTCCPFHFEDTPSCHIFDDRRYTCFGCGAKGTIIDFVLKLKPELGDSPSAAAFYLIDTQGSGRREDYQTTKPFSSPRKLSSAPPVSGKLPVAPAVHRLKIDREKTLAFAPEKIMSIGDQLFTLPFEEAREYAEKRGWLKAPSLTGNYPLGAMAAGESPSFLAQDPALAFPKLIQTRRTAELFGLEKEFEENNRLLCVGIKKRLLPRTSEKWATIFSKGGKKSKPVRWMATSGFVTEIPFEFDANEDAEILVITEGPGDGLRLFNEANADAEIRASWGAKWHIIAVDSCHIWTENSIPRRAVTWGSQNFSVSLFDGFSHVVILLDGDESGRNGVKNIVELVRRQNSSAAIRDVVLPGSQDINDFFDAGNTMQDLAKLLRATPVI